jgi:hypothetical protein
MQTIARLAKVLTAGVVTGACATGVAPSPAPTVPTSSAVSPSVTARPSHTATPALPSPAPSLANNCAGPGADWSDLPDLVETYVAAWSERDPAKRLRLVEEIFTEDGTYRGAIPEQVPAVGHRALAQYIGALQPATAGENYEPAAWTATDIHHDRIRMRWQLCDANGDVQLNGEDIGALDAEGRIREIAGFFDEPDPSPEPEAVCAGPDSADWSQLPEIVRRYGDAWMAEGSVDRAAILEEMWAEDGYYANPFVEAPVIGRQALNDHMDYGRGAGQYIEVTSWAENNIHHDRIRIPWRVCCPSGVVLVDGDDIGELDSDGRMRRVTSFWNDVVELPADVACD